MISAFMTVAAACQIYSVQCQCYNSVMTEGFQIYVVEKCDSKEEWSIYRRDQFDTMAQCSAAIDVDKNCLSLKPVKN